MSGRSRRAWTLVCALSVVASSCRSAPAPPADPFPDSARHIVALGDSFTSGEGAKKFFPGTNEYRLDECRRTWTAYAWVLADRLKDSLAFTACSGALIDDIWRDAQYGRNERDPFAGHPQVSVFEKVASPDVVLIGVGGNDAGFADIGTTCFFHDCTPNETRWLEGVDALEPRLVDVYRRVRTAAGPSATVFATTYPNPLGERRCLPGFSQAEWAFLRDAFVPRLAKAITSAASEAGVNVIDLSDAFDGYRICEVAAGASAMNTVAIGRVHGMGINVRKLDHNTLHPNERGHKLLASVVQQAVSRTHGNPAPTPAPTTAFIVHPFIAEPPATGALVFPAGTPCAGERFDFLVDGELASSGRHEFAVERAAANSTVCFRVNDGSWNSTVAGATGDATVTLAASATSAEVLYQDRAQRWFRVALSTTS